MFKKIFGIGTVGSIIILIYFLPAIIYQGPPLTQGKIADKIVVVKSTRTLTLMDGPRPVKSYRVALGQEPGPKRRQGDNRTPEGRYENCYFKGQSKFHQAIYLTYPNPEEHRRGYTGSAVEIHGLPRLPGNLEKFLGGWIVLLGYTEGCVMVTNPEMEEIARAVKFPVTVEILP